MPFNKKSLENLNPAKKGEVRNPTGKRGPMVKNILKKYFEEKIEKPNPITGDSKMSYLEACILPQIKKAIKGDLAALNALLDRFEGKPKQAVEVKEKKEDDFTEMSDGELKALAQETISELKARLAGGDQEIKEH